jgi:hypothetical protein
MLQRGNGMNSHRQCRRTRDIYAGRRLLGIVNKRYHDGARLPEAHNGPGKLILQEIDGTRPDSRHNNGDGGKSKKRSR